MEMKICLSNNSGIQKVILYDILVSNFFRVDNNQKSLQEN